MLIRKDKEGRLFYFPWGKLGSSYFIPTPLAFEKLNSEIKSQGILFISAFVTLIHLSGWFSSLSLPAFPLVYFFVVLKNKRKLISEHCDWVDTEQHLEQTNPPTFKGLILSLIGLCGIMLASIWIVVTKEDALFYLGSVFILFFSYVLYDITKKIFKKSYEDKG